jgi:hypothetical protein
MNKDRFTCSHLRDVMQQKRRGHSFQEHRGSDLIAQRVGQAHEKIGAHRPYGNVGAGRRAGVSDPVAFAEALDTRTDAFNDARRLHTDHVTRRNEVHVAPPAIDVDEIDANRRLANSRLATAGRLHGDATGNEHLGTTVARNNNLDALDRPDSRRRNGWPTDMCRPSRCPNPASKSCEARLNDLVADKPL